MEQQPSEDTFRRRLGRDRGENFSLPYGVADCAAPPVSKRRLRSGPNLHPGDTHHCADGLFARDKHLVHDSANARRLVLFLARPRAGAAGVETCMAALWWMNDDVFTGLTPKQRKIVHDGFQHLKTVPRALPMRRAIDA